MDPQRIRSILVATDLGEGSQEVVSAAASLAARSGAELHTVHSLQLPWVPTADVMRRTGFVSQIETANQRLQDQGRRVLSKRVTPTSEMVIIYVAHEAILDRAADVAADLIVLGQHRGGALQPRFLGTTADRVVRSAHIPCLIVSEPASFPVERIGIATDFSDSSRGALELALAWAQDLAGSRSAPADDHREVRLVHVAHPMILAGDPDLAEAIQREMSQYVRDTLGARESASPAAVHTEVLWDEQPAEALSGWVSQEQIGLLVLGTQGRNALKRVLLGSTASSMARLAPCPVLLVPPQPQSLAAR